MLARSKSLRGETWVLACWRRNIHDLNLWSGEQFLHGIAYPRNFELLRRFLRGRAIEVRDGEDAEASFAVCREMCLIHDLSRADDANAIAGFLGQSRLVVEREERIHHDCSFACTHAGFFS